MSEETAQPSTTAGTDAKTWNMLCHLTALSGFVTGGLGLILGPLIIWLLKKQEFPSVDVHGKEALNFNITVFIASIALTIIGFITFGIGFFLFPLLGLAWLVLTIIATMKANNGEDYKYPFSLKLIK